MQESLPLLSICIPTYNRDTYLTKSIESIIYQSEFISGDVEIVISDNASTDNTENVGKEYARLYTNIHYYRNAENIRDKNFPLVIGRASGILRKLCNDTLIFNKDSLKFLCDIVKKYVDAKPILFFNNETCKALRSLASEFLDFESFLIKVSYRITWIGAFSIWNTECEGIADDTDGCNLLLWQVKKCCALMDKRKQAVVLEEQFVTIQSVEKKNISYGLYQVFYKNYFSILIPYLEQGALTQNCIESLEKDLLYDFYTGWIVQWERKNKHLQYSEDEDLKHMVFKQYQIKPYFQDYLRFYRWQKVKFIIKCMVKAFLGRES